MENAKCESKMQNVNIGMEMLISIVKVEMLISIVKVEMLISIVAPLKYKCQWKY